MTHTQNARVYAMSADNGLTHVIVEHGNSRYVLEGFADVHLEMSPEALNPFLIDTPWREPIFTETTFTLKVTTRDVVTRTTIPD